MRMSTVLLENTFNSAGLVQVFVRNWLLEFASLSLLSEVFVQQT